MTHARTLATVAGAVAAGLAMAGCGNLVEDGLDRVGQEVETQIENEIGGDIEFGEGAGVPEGFPADFPLPEGTIVASLGTPDGWLVSYELASPDALQPTVDQLQAQGYTLENELNEGGGVLWNLASAEYDVVIVLVTEGQDVATASITVARSAG